ncbi:WD-repeat domain containing protein [Theileria equi strain WA]|uniref:WD-repeat domain containing protein n=1 Tax=Theileria equi strain WA TaxID=1537102 RepID=L0AX97_THEEQ|nr:WD-repeat domain containing protein [Theileria equi strain WA]AFZ79646.1 WD-repeat domain containing protein [Theileria equi strain WA]|eukprot:XP_004829312.1 WD-repeat domain containing protein [Theileria equi strain WA]
MTGKIASLTTAYKESRRFCSFASDTLALLTPFEAILSQHEDCIFAFPFPKDDPNESILLSDSFAQDEGLEVARDYFSKNSTGRSVLCLLDAKEENLYNAPKYQNKCLTLAGGLSTFSLNTKFDVIAVAFCNGILGFFSIHSDEDWLCLKLVRNVKTNTKNIVSISFDGTDRYAACGAVDGTVVVYLDGMLFHTFKNQDSIISLVRFYPNSLSLLSATQNGDIMLYDVKSKIPIAKFEDHLSYITDIAFLVTSDGSPGGFVSCGRDSTINLWSLDITKKEISSATKKNNVLLRKPFKRILLFEPICSIAIVTNLSKDIKGDASWILLVGTENGHIKFIDPLKETTIKERECVYGQGGGLKCLKYSKEMEKIIALGASGSICFYSLLFELEFQLLGNIDGLFHFQLYKGEATTPWTDSGSNEWSNSVRWFRKQIAKGVPLMFTLTGDEVVRVVSLDPLCEHITLGVGNEKYRHADTVLSLAYSQGANILATGSKDESVLVWDLNTLLPILTVNVDGLSVAYLAIPNMLTQDSTRFNLMVSGENVLKSFDLPIHRESDTENVVNTAAATALVHKKVINSIAFSPNNKYVATAGGDKIVAVYTTDNLIVRGKCIGHKRSVVSVSFMTVTKTLVSSSVDQTIKIWNIGDFSCIKTFQGHSKAVMKVIVLPHDLQLVSAGMDGLIKLWNIKTSDCISTLDNHSEKIWDMELCGNSLVSISSNSLLIWWDDVTEELESERLEREREEELKKSQIESLATDGKHPEALSLAVELKKPLVARDLILRCCSAGIFTNEEQGLHKDLFHKWVAHMKGFKDIKSRLTTSFDFIQVWISNNKTAWMANCLLSEILSQFTPEEIFMVEGFKNRIETILIHQSSHHGRMMSLIEKSHILDILVGYNSIPLFSSSDASNTTRNILYK